MSRLSSVLCGIGWSCSVSPQAPSARVHSPIATASARRGAPALRSSRANTSCSASIAVRDRHAPVAAEGAFGDLDAGGRLSALVLGEIDQADRALDLDLGESLGDQLLASVMELDVSVQDPVEQLIRWQRVLVALVVPELGGGRALEDRLRNWSRHPARIGASGGVAPVAEAVDERLGHILYYRKPPCQVTVEGGIADRH